MMGKLWMTTTSLLLLLLVLTSMPLSQASNVYDDDDDGYDAEEDRGYSSMSYSFKQQSYDSSTPSATPAVAVAAKTEATLTTSSPSTTTTIEEDEKNDMYAAATTPSTTNSITITTDSGTYTFTTLDDGDEDTDDPVQVNVIDTDPSTAGGTSTDENEDQTQQQSISTNDQTQQQTITDNDDEDTGDSLPSVTNGGVNLFPYTAEIRAYIVQQHNWARGSLVPTEAANMRQVSWDESLAIEASELVNTCVFEHSTEDYAYGQNLMYGGYTIDEDTVDDWMDSWVTQEISSGDRVGQGTMDLDHASAVLWANTYLVGCASKLCSNGYLTACNYYPPGNWQGEQTYIPGPSCTQCPSQAAYCDATGKLCTKDDSAESIIQEDVPTPAPAAGATAAPTPAPTVVTPAPTTPVTPVPTIPDTPEMCETPVVTPSPTKPKKIVHESCV